MMYQSMLKLSYSKMWVYNKLRMKSNRLVFNTSNQINLFQYNSINPHNIKYQSNMYLCILIKLFIWLVRRHSLPSNAMLSIKILVYSIQLNLCLRICMVRPFRVRRHSIFHSNSSPVIYSYKESYYREV
jgi:hypothetical protein